MASSSVENFLAEVEQYSGAEGDDTAPSEQHEDEHLEDMDLTQSSQDSENNATERPRAERILCEVCDIWTSGPVNHADHLKGKAHARNLLLREKGVKIVGKVGVRDRKAKISKTLQDVKDPLIGLQFVVEFQDDDPRVSPRYVCNLCEDVLDRRYLISHCLGKSHRYKYIDQAYPEKTSLVAQEKTKAGKHAAAETLATEIVRLEGGPQIDNIKVSRNIDPFANERKALMKRSGGTVQPGVTTMGSIIDQVLQQGLGFTDILPLVDCCEIRNPEDAAAAHRVSDILSQKVLDFNTSQHMGVRGGYGRGGGFNRFGPRHRGRGGWPHPHLRGGRGGYRGRIAPY